jgi:mannan endo-1,4-beta-mannosidase
MAARLIRGPGEPGPGVPGRGATRRALIAGTFAGAAGLALGAGTLPAAAAPGAGLAPGGGYPSRPQEFVTVRGGSFHTGGSAWRFGGTNTYYLHQQSHYMIDSALNDAAAASLAVVRAWAFADGSGNGYTAGARAGEQLARLRRHGPVRDVVPWPAR